jgi:hypothetical protein
MKKFIFLIALVSLGMFGNLNAQTQDGKIVTATKTVAKKTASGTRKVYSVSKMGVKKGFRGTKKVAVAGGKATAKGTKAVIKKLP